MLKYKVKSLDEVPEESRGLYKQVGEWFVLQVEGVVDPEVAAADLAAKIKEFRDNNIDLLKKNKDLEEKLKPIEELGGVEGLKKFQELQAKIDADENIKLFTNGRKDEYDARLTAKMREQHQRELEARDKRIADLEGQVKTLQCDIQERDIKAAVDKACAEVRVDPAYADAAGLLIRQQLKYEDGKIIVLGDDGKEAYGPNGKPATVTDALEFMREKRPAFFLPSSGGGAGGGGKSGVGGTTKNPWKRGPDFNLTEQARILKDDPKTAERLRAEAAST